MLPQNLETNRNGEGNESSRSRNRFDQANKVKTLRSYGASVSSQSRIARGAER